MTKQWLIDVKKFTPCPARTRSPAMHVLSTLYRNLPPMSFVRPRTMADNAFDWARRNGRLYKSEIHGEEEADIPLDMNWSKIKESGSKVGFTSGFTMDVPSHTIGVECFLCPSMSSTLIC